MAANKEVLTSNHPLVHAAGVGDLAEVKRLLAGGVDCESQDERTWTALHAASYSGHSDIVRKLIQNGSNVNAVTLKRSTAVHLAAGGGHMSVLRRLQQAGADPHAVILLGDTVLMFAALGTGSLEVVRYLLDELHLDVHATNNTGFTALHCAAQEGHVRVVEELLLKGAKVNFPNNDEVTALHCAAQEGHVRVVEELLLKGAKVNFPNNDEATAFYLAAGRGHMSVLRCLQQAGADPRTVDQDGDTALVWAALGTGSLEVVRYLLDELHLDVHASNNTGFTALHHAAQEGHVGVVEELVHRGANVNAVNDDGATAFHHAAEGGHPSVLRCLQQAGAEPLAVTLRGNTALMYAALGTGSLEVVRYLLHELHLDVHATNNSRDTALHRAAEEGHVGVVEELLHRGANINATNNEGVTAFHCAAVRGHMSVLRCLQQAGADPHAVDQDGNTALKKAALYTDSLEVVRYLLDELHLDVNTSNNKAFTALHSAAQEGHVRVVEKLLHKGANVNCVNNDGVTAFHLAAGNGHMSVLRCLQQAGADPHTVDLFGNTALMYAALGTGSLEVVRYLLDELHLDVHATNNTGSTALHLPAQEGHVRVVEELLLKGANVNCVNNDGETAEMMAVANGHPEIAAYLWLHHTHAADIYQKQTKDLDDTHPNVPTPTFLPMSLGNLDETGEGKTIAGRGQELVRKKEKRIAEIETYNEEEAKKIKVDNNDSGAANNYPANPSTENFVREFQDTVSLSQTKVKEIADLSQIFSNISEYQASIMQSQRKMYMDLINILVAHKYAQMEEDLEVDVSIDVDRCIVSFSSKHMEALTKKNDEMNEFLRSIKSQTFYFPTSTCALLKQGKTANILAKEWRKRNLIIVTDHKVVPHGRTEEEKMAPMVLLAKTEEEITDGVNVIKSMVLVETVNVPGSCVEAMQSDAWIEVCDDLLTKCEGEVLIRVNESHSSIHVTGIRHVIASVLATIKRFLERKNINTKRSIPLFHRGDATSWKWTEAEKRLLTETSGMRVLYIGAYMAGKTSLVRTILSDGSFLNDKDDRTIVAEMNLWVPDPKKKNTFSLVDLGGHETYISSGHFFHCNAKNNVATLCHDIRANKFSKSFKWLKAVLTRSPVCHIVLALTKCDTLSVKEKSEALETFKSELTKYLKKEIHTLETTIFMANEKYSDKLPTFMQLRNHYQWLVDNLDDITFLVSCKEGYEDTVLKVKDHYITLSEKPENKVFLPVHYHSFFCVSGNSGVRIVQERVEKHKPESKSKTDVAAKAPRKTKAENVELNKAKQPKKITQFLTLEEAIKQFDKILKEHQLPADDLPGQMKRCLESLHQHGLMLYFACGKLENIVFNNLNTFISIMRAIFYHDIQHFHNFNKLAITYRVRFYNNEESLFKEDLDLLSTQGLLSAHLLTIFLEKSECEIETKAVIDLFDLLEIGFSFMPDNLEIVHTFIPFFVENKNPSDEICDEMDRMSKCEEKFLSLHCQVRGNITVTLWHYLLVRFCKTLHSSMQRKVIWDGGFLASVGQSQINILMLFNGEDTIDMKIKGQLTSIRSHDLLWYYIGVFNDKIGSLTTDWWPGLITERLLFCTHCKIRGCENVHEWPLHAILKCKEETCRCPSESCDIASGLIAPLPIDATEAEKRLSQVKVHLSKTCQSGITEMAPKGNTLDLNKAVGNQTRVLHSADGDFKLSEEKALHLLQNFTPLVCQIEVPASNSSGFVVGTVTENHIQHHYILTVYHGKLYEALRDPQNNSQCKAKFGSITVRITPPALYWNNELDYVMAQLEPSAILDDYLSGKVPLGQHITGSQPRHNDVFQISGFEANKVIDYGVKCVSIDDHDKVVSIHGDIRRINALRRHSYPDRIYPLSRKFLFYDCSVRHGTSGGPCMSVADNHVYAIHCGAIYQHACDLEYGILIRYVVEDIIRQIQAPSAMAAQALPRGQGQYIARPLKRHEVDNMFLHTPQTMH